MDRIHAFGDDALGDLDAVGLVDALQTGKVSAGELVEAAIARTEAVNPALNGLAFEAFDRARARASSRRPFGGYFDGVPSFIKDNVAVEGMPTMQGTDAWDPRPMPSDGEFARAFLATGLIPLGKTQMSEFGVRLQRVGRAPADRSGPQSMESGIHRRCVVVGIGGICGCRCGADRARQRRWRVDPHSGGVQRACGSEAVASQAAAGQGNGPDAPAPRRQRCGVALSV
jgi:Amidase